MRFKAIAVAVFATLLANQAHSAVNFTQSELLSMQIVGSLTTNYASLYPDDLTATPLYHDSQSGMTGYAGATGNLNANQSPASVYYSLVGTDLDDFVNFVAGSGETTLSMYSFNDNNQPWDLGVWIGVDDGSGGFTVIESTEGLGLLGRNPDGNPQLPVLPPLWWAETTLTLPVDPNDIVYAGVFVRNILSGTSQSDDFHASWGIDPPGQVVPEPASLAIWGALFSVTMAGAVVRYRRDRG